MCERLRHERLPNHHHRQEEPTVARPILAAFVVIDPLMERRGHRTPPRTPPRAGGDWGGAGPRLRDPDDCRRRRYVCWPSSRTGVADDARVRLSVGADRRRALQSSPPSARRWDGLNSGRVGGDVHDGRRGHHREPPPPSAGVPSCARPARSEGAGARMLRVVRGETGEGRWMACASGPPPAARADARADAARRDARPDAPPELVGGVWPARRGAAVGRSGSKGEAGKGE